MCRWLEEGGAKGLFDIGDALATARIMDLIRGAAALKTGHGTEWPGGADRPGFMRSCIRLIVKASVRVAQRNAISSLVSRSLCHSSNDPERPARMGDSGHESEARIVLEPLGLDRLEKQGLPVGLVCIRRDPAAPILAAEAGFRMLLQILDRIFGAHCSRSCVDGHLSLLLPP
ncbi:hypothetical protein ABIE78_003365 [Sinorhizobium fredii]|uniref:hypothetical protein n=1 Tax=Rhizobium fredii TaxID=380 RepID=UPI00059DF134|nr:hypothetical protein [Sinorhizobium fredii]